MNSHDNRVVPTTIPNLLSSHYFYSILFTYILYMLNINTHWPLLIEPIRKFGGVLGTLVTVVFTYTEQDVSISTVYCVHNLSHLRHIS